eukprot:TRINITY_DN24020_c0_g1_i1.p1 TRINITY_DN24020_c0_g1~~TRINITY_DN24020_c0_g1_i1.p1  ORF type:complete len:602 (+),score=134.22 TRINITY_DN24020_c0_g1_i1:63-1808(+)
MATLCPAGRDRRIRRQQQSRRCCCFDVAGARRVRWPAAAAGVVLLAATGAEQGAAAEPTAVAALRLKVAALARRVDAAPTAELRRAASELQREASALVTGDRGDALEPSAVRSIALLQSLAGGPDLIQHFPEATLAAGTFQRLTTAPGRTVDWPEWSLLYLLTRLLPDDDLLEYDDEVEPCTKPFKDVDFNGLGSIFWDGLDNRHESLYPVLSLPKLAELNDKWPRSRQWWSCPLLSAVLRLGWWLAVSSPIAAAGAQEGPEGLLASVSQRVEEWTAAVARRALRREERVFALLGPLRRPMPLLRLLHLVELSFLARPRAAPALAQRRALLGTDSVRWVSQYGQDRWVHDFYCGLEGGFFADIGSARPVELSNSFALEHWFGWSGLCVDVLPRISSRRCRQIRAAAWSEAQPAAEFTALVDPDSLSQGLGSRLTAVGEAQWWQEDGGTAGASSWKELRIKVPAKTLHDLLEEAGAPGFVHFLSVDTEGAEHAILRSFFRRAARQPAPRRIGVLAVEAIGPGRDLQRARLARLLRAGNYSLAATLGTDEIWVHPDAEAHRRCSGDARGLAVEPASESGESRG